MGSVPPVLRPNWGRYARGNPKAPWATALLFAALAVRGSLAGHRAPTAAHTGRAVSSPGGGAKATCFTRAPHCIAIRVIVPHDLGG